MSRIEKSYNLRNECLSQERVFTDSFLINLYEYIENDMDKEKYIDILNTEFRGEIPKNFLEELLLWMKVV